MALDYIGKRGSAIGVPKDKRIQYAREILQRELLPHVAIGEYCETKKAYFYGYMIHRLLLVRLRGGPGRWGRHRGLSQAALPTRGGPPGPLAEAAGLIAPFDCVLRNASHVAIHILTRLSSLHADLKSLSKAMMCILGDLEPKADRITAKLGLSGLVCGWQHTRVCGGVHELLKAVM